METLGRIVAVGIGGAAGAVARYLINISPLQNLFGKFPLPTFFVNVSGSFLIGFLLIVLTDRIEVSEYVRFAVIVGFLGAFTTFSTFEAEIWGLIQQRSFVMALLYLTASVIAGFAGVLGGIWLGRSI